MQPPDRHTAHELSHIIIDTCRIQPAVIAVGVTSTPAGTTAVEVSSDFRTCSCGSRSSSVACPVDDEPRTIRDISLVDAVGWAEAVSRIRARNSIERPGWVRPSTPTRRPQAVGVHDEGGSASSVSASGRTCSSEQRVVRGESRPVSVSIGNNRGDRPDRGSGHYVFPGRTRAGRVTAALPAHPHIMRSVQLDPRSFTTDDQRLTAPRGRRPLRGGHRVTRPRADRSTAARS
jgi:hypothetical protein